MRSPPGNEAAPRTAHNGATGPRTSKELQPSEKSRTAASGQRPDDDGVVVDFFPKNKRGEYIKIRAKTFEGVELVDVRVFCKHKSGDIGPTKKGIAIPLRHLPRVIEALSKALPRE